MSAIGLGCVKTQKSQNRRELFFSDQAKANTLKNSRRYNCDSEKRSFYRRRAPLRFYTAKVKMRPSRLSATSLFIPRHQTLHGAHRTAASGQQTTLAPLEFIFGGVHIRSGYGTSSRGCVVRHSKISCRCRCWVKMRLVVWSATSPLIPQYQTLDGAGRTAASAQVQMSGS